MLEVFFFATRFKINTCFDLVENRCNRELIDTVLDWEDALPASEFKESNNQCKQADVVLCLATSLRIEPVGNMPFLSPV